MGGYRYTEIMSRPWLVLSFATVAAFGLAQVIPEKQFETADRLVVRLRPTAFLELPKNLVADLQRCGCTIPQVPMIKEHQNVIKGEFAKPGQTDWAVLCSVGRVSSILVFWNGSEISPGQIAEMNDIDRIQSWGGGKLAYSRAITPVGDTFINQHIDANGGLKMPPIQHWGIDDAFVGKASVVLYLYQGKWLQLTGAD